MLKPLFLLSLLFIAGSGLHPSFEDVFDDTPNTVDHGIHDVAVHGGGEGGGFDTFNGGSNNNGRKSFPFHDGEESSGGVSQVEAFLGKQSTHKSYGAKKSDYTTHSLGSWEIHSMDAGVSAMQIQLLPNNKAIMYDFTSLGPSNIMLKPATNCRPIPGKANEFDCWAHAVEYDIETAEIRTLKLLSDSWCSSGGLTPDGTLISTGGFQDGYHAVRLLSPCEGCDWLENPLALSQERWYASQEKLEDGSFIIFGGRNQFNYEYIQNSLHFPQKKVDLPLLKETKDEYENNLYPFVNLLPDGTIFLFANNRSIIVDPKTDQVIRELPVLLGGSRNFPASGMSALLPLKLTGDNHVDAEVLICGGARHEGHERAEFQKTFLPALQDCGRIMLTDPNSDWKIEMMPTRRVMGDMLLLPTGDVLMINGAMYGVGGWNLADGPNLKPVLYHPNKEHGGRFKELKASQIPRMYHSSSTILPNGKVLVAGSNTNPTYNLTNLVQYPTELRVEKFSPPYLDPSLDKHRPYILETVTETKLVYGRQFIVKTKLDQPEVDPKDLKVTMLAPPFTTHGYSMNQRLIVLEVLDFTGDQVTVVAPPSGKIAPPGYYLLYVVHRGVPSHGMWVKIN